MTKPLYHLTIGEASRLIKAKKLSPVELTQAFLDRTGKLDETLHAYNTVTADSALAEAKIAEVEITKGRYKGPLHGIPIALKDNYNTKGILTTAGSRVLANNVPDEDCTAWAKLKGAGTILLGKLAMSEYACGGPDPETGFPMPRNPWDLKRNAGGSSNGSAVATSAGLCMASMGTCTRGSIRAPAHFCNIVGFKPTYGRISRNGVIPLSWTLDHCGPMTVTVEDAAIMLRAVAGHDSADPTSSAEPVPDYPSMLKPDIKGLRIGVPRHFYFSDRSDVQREPLRVADVALRKLEELGAHVEEIEIPSLKYSDPAALVLLLGEGFAYHQRRLLAQPELYGGVDRAEFRVAATFTLGDYVQAQRARSLMQQEFLQALDKVDLIAGPTFSVLAPLWDAPPGMAIGTGTSFTGMYNLTGLPAISVPAGFSPSGLPSGIQFAGKPFDEPTVLRAAYAYEQATEWHTMRPPV